MIVTGKKFSKPAMSRVINGDTVLASAPEKPEKFRLDHLLMQLHPEFNRSSLQKFIRAGYVTVNGETVQKPNSLFENSAQITLTLPPELADHEAKQKQIAAARPATIYEDDNVLVLNKPAGLLSVAKGEICPEPTLEDYGLLVHRLDRDTSGVVILAKNPETQSMLRRQFQERKTHKTYYAIIAGRPKMDAALIDLPIARNLKRPNTFIVAAGGKPSQTNYRLLKTTGNYSLLELKPVTGRTHQLRVHLKYLGHPILGDPVYSAQQNSDNFHATNGTTDNNANNTDSPNRIPARLYLHAASLEITIPNPDDHNGHNQRMTFTAPLPEEFEHVLR